MSNAFENDMKDTMGRMPLTDCREPEPVFRSSCNDFGSCGCKYPCDKPSPAAQSGAVEDLPPLPEPVDTLCEADGYNVIGSVPVFSIGQMAAYARAAVALSRAQTAPALEADLAWHKTALARHAEKLHSVWNGISHAVEKYSGKPCEGEPFDRLDELLAALSADAAQPVSKELRGRLRRAVVFMENGERVNIPQLAKDIDALLSRPSALAPVSVQPTFPERDPSKPAEQQGLFRKFHVRRVDGSDQPGGKHHGCRYFVLDLDHDKAAPAAMRAYAAEIRATHQKLADDIEAEFGEQPAQEERFCSDLCRTLGNGPCPHVGEQPAPCGGKIGYYSARSSGFSERRCEKCGWRPPRELLDVKNCPRIPSNNQPAAQTAGVREGWKLVPLEPTEAMWEAWENAEPLLMKRRTLEDGTIAETWKTKAGTGWDAMLAAAPQPVVEQVGEPGGLIQVPVERLQNAAAHAKLAADCIVGMAKEKPGNMCGWLDDACTSADIAHDVLRKLLAAHPQAAQAKGGDK